MIKVSHECPKSLFEKSKGFNDYEYCLGHLYASDPGYKAFYKEQSASGRECILDNSIFEGRGLSNEEFADIIMDLKPSHYIIPDVLEYKDAPIYKSFLKPLAMYNLFSLLFIISSFF